VEQRQIIISPDAFTELSELLDLHRDMGAESFIKPFREFCERHGWNWFGLEPKRIFNFNAMQLVAAYGRGRYYDERLRQLQNGAFAFWVFKAEPECPDAHIAFNGLALRPDHGFWNRYFPPLGWRCGCYVVGTGSEAGIRRLGGDPDKRPPGWWSRIDPVTELPPGIEEPWGTPEAPSLLLLLAAMVDGHSPKPDFG
jgi:hypothetical protein